MRVDRDPRRADHYYAYVEDYLEFDRPVSFRDGRFFYESRLQKEDGSVNKGMFGHSVRLLPDAEYGMILAAGFETATVPRERLGVREGVGPDRGGLELVDRPIIERLSRRPFRDRVFSTGIRVAYDNTGTVTGLRIVNGGGRAEARAAHIRPVRADGPDSPRARRRAELHLSLDVRPRPDLDRRRLQPAGSGVSRGACVQGVANQPRRPESSSIHPAPLRSVVPAPTL